ncbi:MAG: hypothetical protein PHF74_08080 [Dehalococcoidales bacterium]|nr:hypothetical protein [Dehalococcoidales bacterium]
MRNFKPKNIRRLVLISVFACFLIISFAIHYRGATSRDVYVWNSDPVLLADNLSRVWDWNDLQFMRGITPAFIEWHSGFSVLEGNQEHNWRWCSREGTLVLNNTSKKNRKVKISAIFITGYPEMSNLCIESTLVTENLTVNNAGYIYNKEITIPPGRHEIKFSCDARKIEAPNDPRYLVFNITNFQIAEVE